MNLYYYVIFNLVILTNNYIPQNGDLLFQDIDCGPLCNSIERVTEGINGAKFSHVGVFVEKDSGFYILEAISSGVVFTSFHNFLKRSKDSEGNPKVIVGRLKEEYQLIIPKAIIIMRKYIGKPYDTVFSMTNDAYYCSELIYLGFSKASSDSSFFKLNPMTYKVPGANSYFSEWEEYFNNIDVEIPEGKPGINPGGISRSDKIEIIYLFGKPDGYKQ